MIIITFKEFKEIKYALEIISKNFGGFNLLV